MKMFYLIPLLFLSACSTTPKLTLRPQPSPPATDNSAVRYPEIVRAYHFGRYVDPDDDLVMHEEHTVYRVEENTRWNLHPAPASEFILVTPSGHDTAFAPAPVNDAVLAEVNSQRLATTQIMIESKILAAALQQLEKTLQDARKNEQATASLQAAVNDMKKRLDTLEATPAPPLITPLSTTNEPDNSLSP
jgi:hypothetical protein